MALFCLLASLVHDSRVTAVTGIGHRYTRLSSSLTGLKKHRVIRPDTKPTDKKSSGSLQQSLSFHFLDIINIL
jgi:hypothetical protein